MYTKPPTAQELAAWGLVPSDIAAVELWQENLPAYELFEFMGTQWRAGTGGATGLDYSVAYQRLDRLHLDPGEYEDRLDSLRVMEFAALAAMAETRTE